MFSFRHRLLDPERSTLAEIGKRLGRKALKRVGRVAQPDTILAWYRRSSFRSSMVPSTAPIRGGRESGVR